MSDTAQLDSLLEEGASTAKDVTRKVSALELVQHGAQQVAQAGPRPAAYVHSKRPAAPS